MGCATDCLSEECGIVSVLDCPLRESVVSRWLGSAGTDRMVPFGVECRLEGVALEVFIARETEDTGESTRSSPLIARGISWRSSVSLYEVSKTISGAILGECCRNGRRMTMSVCGMFQTVMLERDRTSKRVVK